MRPGAGRKPRLTEQDRSRILALVKWPPPGRLERQGEGLAARDEEGAAQWSLDALEEAAKDAGMEAQTQPDSTHLSARRGALARDPQLGRAAGPGLRPKRTAVVTHSTEPPEGSTTIGTDELGPGVPRSFAPAPGWSATGHRIQAPLDYSRGPEKVWISGALRVKDGKELDAFSARTQLHQLHRSAG